MTAAVPVSLITGFLGSGKTTLLNRLLDDGALRNAALIINEFGDVGIDHLLVETADEGIVELSDGCLCCTIRGDLVDTLGRLLDRSSTGAPLERIIIETTGLADPAPILHAVMGHPYLSDKLRLDGVITLVDGVNGISTLQNHQEAVKQAAIADRLVVTKTDLAETSSALVEELIRINPTAKLFDAVEHNPDFSDLFECGLYNPLTKSADVQRWLNDEALTSDHHHHHDVNRHSANIRAFSLTSDQAVDSGTLVTFLDMLRSAHGPNLLRVKGIINMRETPDQPVVIHGVQQIFHPPATLSHWPQGDRKTRLVMITKDLSEDFVQRLFDAFMGNVRADTPDRESLENNPLVIPGHTSNFSGH